MKKTIQETLVSSQNSKFGSAVSAGRTMAGAAFVAARMVLLVGALTLAGSLASAVELRDLWAERVKSVVAVEFFTEMEIDRRPTVTFGLVADDAGTIIIQGGAVNARSTPSQLKDFRIYLPGESAHRYAAGTYLGQDSFTGWHFIRVAESMRPSLVPITKFAAANPAAAEVKLTDLIWGVGLRAKDEDFAPYYLESKIAMLQTLPQRTGICLDDVAAPGLPVFNSAGVFTGVAVGGFGQTFMQISQRDRGGLPVVLINVGESSAFHVASEVLPHLGRIPKDVYGRPVTWLGIQGLQPIDPEVAGFMKLDSACVVSEVLAGGPAEKAGFKDRDIIVGLDGKPVPRLKPDRVVVGYVEREIDRRSPGDVMRFTVLRGQERIELSVTLTEEPKLQREADRKYFDRIGLTSREFVFADGVARRAPVAEHTGVIAHFVKANSPAATAGLQFDDWIKEIDGVPVKSYADAAAQLAAIEADKERAELVLLVRRGGDTQVMRVKLK